MVRAGFTLWGWGQVVPENTRNKGWSAWLFSEFWISTSLFYEALSHLRVRGEPRESKREKKMRKPWPQSFPQNYNTGVHCERVLERAKCHSVRLWVASRSSQGISNVRSRGRAGEHRAHRTVTGRRWVWAERTALRTMCFFQGAFSCPQGLTLRE